jgi:MoxR-like ATPase
MDITHAQLENFIKIGYKTKLPIFVSGTMGIGKSYSIRKSAQAIGKELKLDFLDGEADGTKYFSFIDVRLSQFDSSDLRGIPMPDLTHKFIIWLVANWLPKDMNSKGILFLDELNLAPPSIQASAYQLILDRKIGDYKLPIGWLVVGAGNTSEDKANIFELPAPLCNRFLHINLAVPSKDEWVNNYALKNDIHTSIIAFLELFPSYIFKFDRKNKDKAFSTPRTLEFLSRLLREADNQKMDLEEKEILISSAVGDGFAKEFIAFLRLQKSININELLENPQKVKEITAIDLKLSLLSAITEKYRTDNKKDMLEKILFICDNLDSEYSILLLRYLRGIGKNKFFTELPKCKNFKIVEKYTKYLMDLKEDKE